MRITQTQSALSKRACGVKGFTLAEVIVSIAVASIAAGGMIYGYILSGRRSEWSGYSLAAQALAVQRVEQIRAAKWDTQASPAVDQLNYTNFPAISTGVLDLPVSGTNLVRVTNYTTLSTIQISASPVINVKFIRVDTVWAFNSKRFSNTVVTYRAPDQ